MSVTNVILSAGGIGLSGLEARAEGGPTRATILALPGGGYTSRYWHNPVDPDGSLVELGARLGYRVIALDRPGYGLSVEHGAPLADQAARLSDLVEDLGAAPESGAGVFLIGHSMGGILSLMIAALQRNARLLGVDVSGVPRRFTEQLSSSMDDTVVLLKDQPAVAAPVDPKAALFYGPAGTYDPRMLASEDAWSAAPPLAEMEDAYTWPSRFTGVSEKVRIPVQYTLGEFEQVTKCDWPALEEIRGCFPNAARIVMQRQPGASHNVSLHRIARAYHLRALAFFDEILALA